MITITRLQLISCLFILIQVSLIKSDPLKRSAGISNLDDEDDMSAAAAAASAAASVASDSIISNSNEEASNEERNNEDGGFYVHSLIRKQLMLKRSSPNRLVKKIKPIILNGYSMDINIDTFKSNVSYHIPKKRFSFN